MSRLGGAEHAGHDPVVISINGIGKERPTDVRPAMIVAQEHRRAAGRSRSAAPREEEPERPRQGRGRSRALSNVRSSSASRFLGTPEAHRLPLPGLIPPAPTVPSLPRTAPAARRAFSFSGSRSLGVRQVGWRVDVARVRAVGVEAAPLGFREPPRSEDRESARGFARPRRGAAARPGSRRRCGTAAGSGRLLPWRTRTAASSRLRSRRAPGRAAPGRRPRRGHVAAGDDRERFAGGVSRPASSRPAGPLRRLVLDAANAVRVRQRRASPGATTTITSVLTAATAATARSSSGRPSSVAASLSRPKRFERAAGEDDRR